MKTFSKTIIFSLLISIFSTITIISFSCKPDKCKTTNCANGGTCNDGNCICMTGYSGTSCEITNRDIFLGQWTVNETGTRTAAFEYALNIQKDTLIDHVVIIGLYNYFHLLRAYVVGDTLVIPNQQIQGKVVFGKGYIFSTDAYPNNGVIQMQYEVVDTATQLVNDFGYNYLVDHSKPSIWNR